MEIHQGVSPAAGETVFTKTKPGPFSTTALDVTLKDMGKDTLVVMGVATGGCVLSAARWATDFNYKFIVLSDACSDEDPEVHRVLTEKIFPRRGTVMTTQQFLETIRDFRHGLNTSSSIGCSSSSLPSTPLSVSARHYSRIVSAQVARSRCPAAN